MYIHATATTATRTTTFKCYECVDPNTYGNGIYVVIERQDGERFIIDCRYDPAYTLESTVSDWIKSYYGKNLVNYSLAVCID